MFLGVGYWDLRLGLSLGSCALATSLSSNGDFGGCEWMEMLCLESAEINPSVW